MPFHLDSSHEALLPVQPRLCGREGAVDRELQIILRAAPAYVADHAQVRAGYPKIDTHAKLAAMALSLGLRIKRDFSAGDAIAGPFRRSGPFPDKCHDHR